MSDKNVNIMDDLIQAVVQTDEWETIHETDPGITQADKEIVSLLCEVKNYIPRDLYLKIENAIYGYSNAVSIAAMLYGMHVIDVIRDVSARPQDLSRHIMDRARRADI